MIFGRLTAINRGHWRSLTTSVAGLMYSGTKDLYTASILKLTQGIILISKILRYDEIIPIGHCP